jgi:type VI secretion system protein ImpG
MDRRLLGYYNRELQYLRETGAEFAREFPKIAGRLGLKEFSCADPYVERLLEGFAFLAARVQLKLDAEFPRFTQSLLETVYPQYLSPTPSMAVCQFQPDPNEGGLAAGYRLARGTPLRSVLGRGDTTSCEYRTAHDLTLWPLRIVEARYYTRELGSLGLPPQPDVRAALRVRLACTAGVTFDQLRLDDLTFHLLGSGSTPARLYEHVFAHGRSVAVMPATRPPKWAQVLRDKPIQQVGFDDDQSLLPYDARAFHGYRLLHEYFAFPQRFLFFKLAGIGDAVRRCSDPMLDLVVLFREPDLSLEGQIDAANLALFCTPTVNLFPMRTDRIPVTDQFSEFHVIPDRTKPLDYEVYQVTSVTGFGRTQEEQVFSPFYAARDTAPDGGGAYYTAHRVPRMATDREQRAARRSSYDGSDVYLSLVDARCAPYRPDLKQLAVEALCTNRDLPPQLATGQGRTDFTLDAGPVEAVRVVSGAPSAPRASRAEGESAWRLINFMVLNYLSLEDRDDAANAQAVRDLLGLFGNSAEPHVKAQIAGVQSVKGRPTVSRVGRGGPIAFARGIEVTVTLEDAAFEGAGPFLLGAVLEHFFTRHVSINSFTKTTLRTVARGEVMKWPARAGLRQLL